MAMAGWVSALLVHARFDEGSRLASEFVSLLESIGDPTLTLGLLYSAVTAKYQHGEMTEAVRLAQRMIDLADGDAAKGNLIVGSPLASATLLRGCARCFLGDPGFRADIDQAVTMVRAFEPALRAIVLLIKYVLHAIGVWLPDAAALDETAELLDIAERSGDNLTLACAQYIRGLALVAYFGPQREDAFALLAAAREAALQERSMMSVATFVEVWQADEKIRVGDLDAAIELLRAAVEEEYGCGDMTVLACAAATLVRALLRRGGPTDLREAQAAINRLAAVPTEPGLVIHDIWLLRMRASTAQARGDEGAYQDYRDRYRTMANSLGFEGHIKWATEME